MAFEKLRQPGACRAYPWGLVSFHMQYEPRLPSQQGFWSGQAQQAFRPIADQTG